MTIRVDTMRRIDHLAGVPLCAILTPIVYLYDFLRGFFTPKTISPKKVLFIELSEMGSAILVDPAMRETLNRGAQIYFLIFKSNAVSLSLLETVPKENILTIDASGLFSLIKTTISSLFKIHGLGIDTVIDLELFSRFTALLTGCSGANRRVGYHIFHGEGLWRGDLLTHKVHYNPHIHISKNFLSLVHAAFATEQELPFSKIPVANIQLEIAQAQVSLSQKETLSKRICHLIGVPSLSSQTPIILINPNASDLLPQRRWAPDRFAQLIHKAAEKWPSAYFLITGSAAEKAYTQNVLDLSKTSRAFNFAGMVDFKELPALYHVSTLMVTNDSGPGHFSSVTPLPTIVLFGPETPALYGSLGKSIPIFAGLACSPCVSAANHRKTPCTNNLCMQAIEVPQVIQAMDQCMNMPNV
jgi:ADP-heptose:LPS heptosyltransferase